MAGTYQDVPGQKIAYDIDGTYIVQRHVQSDTITNLSPTTVTELIDHDSTIAINVGAGVSAEYHFSWVFPQPITLRGLWGTVGRESVGIGSDPGWGTFYSLDTTDGVDGTWTTLFAHASTPAWTTHGIQQSTAVEPEMRSEIKTLASPITGVKGFRIRVTNSNTRDAYIRLINLYGEVTSPDYLEFWHPTLDQQLSGAYFDWGNTTLSTSQTRTFRIKNTNPTMQAHDVQLSLGTHDTASPSPTTWHSLSSDGSSFSSTLNIGHIPANSTSGVLALKRDTPSNAQLALMELRIIATTTGFG